MDLKQENGAAVQNGSAKQANGKAETASAAKANATNGAAKQEPKQELPTEVAKAAPQPEADKPAAIPLTGLEDRLRVVGDLHRRSVQRLNLISRLNQIEAFEVTLAKDGDELEDNPYQGCRLIIEDDKGRQFVTKTPGLIRLVSQFIFTACNEKLAEIEAAIVFPKA